MMLWPETKAISLNDISIYNSWPFCSTERTVLIHCGKWYQEEYFFRDFLKFGPLVQEMSFEDISNPELLFRTVEDPFVQAW